MNLNIGAYEHSALQKATGKTGKGFEAHHTLPQKHRSKFEKLEIELMEKKVVPVSMSL